MTVRLTEDMHRAAAIQAAETGQNISEVLRTAILTYLIQVQPLEFGEVLHEREI